MGVNEQSVWEKRLIKDIGGPPSILWILINLKLCSILSSSFVFLRFENGDPPPCINDYRIQLAACQYLFRFASGWAKYQRMVCLVLCSPETSSVGKRRCNVGGSVSKLYTKIA